MQTGRAIRFESRNGLLILSRVASARADVGEAELLEDLADRALVVDDAEALGNDPLQVDAAPAHDAVPHPTRASLDKLRPLRLLIRR